MPDLRVDPLTGLQAIVAADRAQRPGAGLSTTPPEPIDADEDPFAPGHEDRTPPEVHALRPDGTAPDSPGWTVRVVPNLYPALVPDAPEPEPEPEPEPRWRRVAVTSGRLPRARPGPGPRPRTRRRVRRSW